MSWPLVGAGCAATQMADILSCMATNAWVAKIQIFNQFKKPSLRHKGLFTCLSHPRPMLRSLACHPIKAEVACGFQSGVLRVWDAGSTALLHESRQHTGPVVQVAFARHGRMLLSLGEMC